MEAATEQATEEKENHPIAAMQIYEISGFTLTIATEASGATISAIAELTHPASQGIGAANITANLNGPTFEHATAEPCDNCCADCANRAAVARGRAIG